MNSLTPFQLPWATAANTASPGRGGLSAPDHRAPEVHPCHVGLLHGDDHCTDCCADRLRDFVLSWHVGADLTRRNFKTPLISVSCSRRVRNTQPAVACWLGVPGVESPNASLASLGWRSLGCQRGMHHSPR
jgi:hypothetical protein